MGTGTGMGAGAEGVVPGSTKTIGGGSSGGGAIGAGVGAAARIIPEEAGAVRGAGGGILMTDFATAMETIGAGGAMG